MPKYKNFDNETPRDADPFGDNPALKRLLDSVVYDARHPVKKRMGKIKQHLRDFYYNWDEPIKYLAGYSLIMGLCLLGTRGCNMIWNDSETTTPSRHTISHATGLVGHNEYTRYKDGSADLKIYPGNPLGHRWFESKLYQDLDGDGKVDRIRINGSEFSLHHLRDIFSRNQDYTAHSEEFNLGDRLLAEESKKLK